ncbi:MAG: tetratricopeptide repeat protein [Methanoregulaceae archaeon]|jgi:tetratricopeptide (TPR) repeat protein
MRMQRIMGMVVTAICLLSLVLPASGVVSIAASPGTWPVPADMAEELKTAGFEAISEQNWTGLSAIASSGLSLDPDDPVFSAMKGYALRKLGNSSAALPFDTRAIEIQPNAVRYANRGVTYLALGNYTAALADGQASAALEPDYATAYALMAQAYLGLGDTPAAQQAIHRALVIEQESASHWHVQGLVALAAGNCTLAVSSLERSIALDPDYSLPWPGMPDASADLEMARVRCRTDLPAEGGTGTPGAPLGAVIALLAVPGAFLLARRR